MPTYSRTDRLAAIQKAGFPEPLTALAVSLAEFGENRDINAQSQSDYVSGGVREPSFGPWQIHLPSHPDVAQSCAMDLTCSTNQAFAISKGGTDFGPWSAFTNGSYARFLPELAGLIPSASSPSTSGSGSSLTAGSAGGSAPAGPPDWGLPGDLLQRIKSRIIAYNASVFLGQMTSADAAARLKAEFPQVPVEILRAIAYGLGADIGSNTLPGEEGITKLTNAVGSAASAVGSAGEAVGKAGNAIGVAGGAIGKATDFGTSGANWWKLAFAILGGAMIFFGAKLYFHQDVGSEQGVVNA